MYFYQYFTFLTVSIFTVLGTCRSFLFSICCTERSVVTPSILRTQSLTPVCCSVLSIAHIIKMTALTSIKQIFRVFLEFKQPFSQSFIDLFCDPFHTNQVCFQASFKLCQN